MKNSKLLRELILSEETLVMPDAYDGLSARIIEKTGYPAVQCSGYSVSLSKQLANEKKLSKADNLKITEEIVNAVSIPVMADGENGYGNNEVLSDTILRFININCAGINIEDQSFSEESGKIISIDEMLDKIRIIKDTILKSNNHSFVLNARTDALLMDDRKEGQKEAIKRANLYLENGADLAFICYTKTYEELKLFAKEIDGPISIAAGLPYNINNFSVKDCQDLGIARVSLPVTIVFNVIKSMFDDLEERHNDYSFEKIREKWKDVGVYLDRMK